MKKYTIEEIINTKDPEILAEVLKRGHNDWVSCWAACNKNCPSEALAEVLKREKNDGVSINAAKNPKCHPKEILDWYEATNQLTKYDPKIHELEKIPIDNDLEELKRLL